MIKCSINYKGKKIEEKNHNILLLHLKNIVIIKSNSKLKTIIYTMGQLE